MMSKEQHVDGLVQTKNNKNSTNNNKISESYKKLTQSEKLKRINGAVDLIQHLKAIKYDENQVCLGELRIFLNCVILLYQNYYRI